MQVLDLPHTLCSLPCEANLAIERDARRPRGELHHDIGGGAASVGFRKPNHLITSGGAPWRNRIAFSWGLLDRVLVVGDV